MLTDVAVKLVSALSPACRQMSCEDLGKGRFSSKGKMPELPKHPGWAGSLLLPSPGRDTEGREQRRDPRCDAAVLPDHQNRRRQLGTAVKCHRDRRGDALASSLLPPLTQVIDLLTSPPCLSVCLSNGRKKVDKTKWGWMPSNRPGKEGFWQFWHIQHTRCQQSQFIPIYPQSLPAWEGRKGSRML